MANLFSEKPIVKVVMLKGQDGEEKLINQADGSGLSFWVGTQAEYDAIPEAELVANCVYYITDDTRDDFNTRLNQLDTKVDNNTTAIAGNTTDIAENTADIAENTADIEDIENDIKYIMQSSQVMGVTYVAANARIIVSGHLSNLRKKITFSIITEKSIEDVTAINPLIFKANIRHVDGGFIGAVDYTDGGVEFYPNSPYTITATKANNHCITFELESSTEFTTAVANNTPVGVEINALEFGLE